MPLLIEGMKDKPVERFVKRKKMVENDIPIQYKYSFLAFSFSNFGKAFDMGKGSTPQMSRAWLEVVLRIVSLVARSKII